MSSTAIRGQGTSIGGGAGVTLRGRGGTNGDNISVTNDNEVEYDGSSTLIADDVKEWEKVEEMRAMGMEYGGEKEKGTGVRMLPGGGGGLGSGRGGRGWGGMRREKDWVSG